MFMHIWIARAITTAALLIPASWSSAQPPSATVDQFIDGMLSISASKCLRRGDLSRDYDRQGKAAESDAARNGEIMICDCFPNRLRQLRTEVSRQERSVRVTEAEFSARYMSRIFAPCTGEGLRRTYSEGCIDRFRNSKQNPASYCTCMNQEIGRFTDLEAMELGRESADYMPLAAEAKKQGRPIPDQPPLLKRMTDMDAMCSGK